MSTCNCDEFGTCDDCRADGRMNAIARNGNNGEHYTTSKSVAETLAERGKRYGDFTDHAEICQRIKLAMIAGSAKWACLSDVQKQALEVIADKIARILSGDPDYADNWHDIQGYAKLVEDRLDKENHNG